MGVLQQVLKNCSYAGMRFCGVGDIDGWNMFMSTIPDFTT